MWIMFIVIYIIVQNFGVRKFSFWKWKPFFIKQGCVKLIKSDLSYHTISVSFALFIHETVNEK